MLPGSERDKDVTKHVIFKQSLEKSLPAMVSGRSILGGTACRISLRSESSVSSRNEIIRVAESK